MEPEMSYARSLIIPGKEMLLVMGKMLAKNPAVKILEDYLLLRFLRDDSGVSGAVFFDIRKGGIAAVSCKAVILASGSYGEIYPGPAQEPMGVRTGSTGTGQAAALEAGADLVDMEMTQFAMVPVDPQIVLGLRCLPDAPMTNARGENFLPKGKGSYSFEVGHAIWKEYNEGRGPVQMDLREQGHPPAGKARHFLFPHKGQYLGSIGATPYRRIIHVGLGALFTMGGIHINERCETGIPGLYAAGEVSANVHGARRVSGNALSEIIVFGARSGQFAAEYSRKRGAFPDIKTAEIDEMKALVHGLASKKDGQEPEKIRNSVKSIMGQYAFVERDKKGLTKALEELNKLEKELGDISAGSIMQYNLNLVAALDLRSMVTISKIVCMAALAREESRGFHYRSDFPKEKETAEHTVIRMNKGVLSSGTKPVQM